MKKVRFLTSVSSVIGSFAGDEVAMLDATLADQWANAGFVEIVEVAAPVVAARFDEQGTEPPAPAAVAPEAPARITPAPHRRGRK